MSEKNRLQQLKNELQKEEKINSKLNKLKDKSNIYKLNNKLWTSNIALTTALTTAIANYNFQLSSVYRNLFYSLSISNIQVYKSKLDLLKMAKLQLGAFDTELCNHMINGLFSIIQQQRNLFVHLSSISGFKNYYYKSIIELAKALTKEPENIENWEKYYDELTKYFWVIPFNISEEDLGKILEEVGSEQEFDIRISKYFNKTKVNEIFKEIESQLKGDKLKMFKQIRIAYNNRLYALASQGLLSMIDDELSSYLINKGKPKRDGIFEPIITELKKEPITKETLMVMMVSSNINLVFKDYDLNKVNIETHKIVRRHPILHGKLYDNKKIDSIMLFNTFYCLISIRKFLIQYKCSLMLKGRKFKIATKEEKKEILEKIRNNK